MERAGILRPASEFARLPHYVLADLLATMYNHKQTSQDARTATDEAMTHHLPVPVPLSDDVLLEPDLLASIFGSLDAPHASAARVCKPWASAWAALMRQRHILHVCSAIDLDEVSPSLWTCLYENDEDAYDVDNRITCAVQVADGTVHLGFNGSGKIVRYRPCTPDREARWDVVTTASTNWIVCASAFEDAIFIGGHHGLSKHTLDGTLIGSVQQQNEGQLVSSNIVSCAVWGSAIFFCSTMSKVAAADVHTLEPLSEWVDGYEATLTDEGMGGVNYEDITTHEGSLYVLNRVDDQETDNEWEIIVLSCETGALLRSMRLPARWLDIAALKIIRERLYIVEGHRNEDDGVVDELEEGELLGRRVLEMTLDGEVLQQCVVRGASYLADICSVGDDLLLVPDFDKGHVYMMKHS